MKVRSKGTLLLPLVALLFSWTFSFPAEQSAVLPAAAGIMDRYVTVTGGRSAYERLSNITSRGVFTVKGSDMRGTFQAFEAEPDMSLSILQIEGGDRIEEGTRGDIAWFRSSGHATQIKAGEEKKIALREAKFNARLRWREIYPKVECIGTEIVEGRSCYKVVLTPAIGRPITHFYDAGSGLLVKSLIILAGPSGLIPSENLYGDYQTSGGVLFPRQLTHRVNSEETKVVLESVECNTNLAPGLFELPPDIR